MPAPHEPSTPPAASASGPTLGDLGESGLLSRIFGLLDAATSTSEGVLVGPGDDTAMLSVVTGGILATTDAMVRGQDWRDDWSTPQDVGGKIVTQNLADLAAMGGRGTGLLVTLVAPQDLPVAWVEGLTEGLAAVATDAGVPVVGGDLSSAAPGVVMVSVTALGELADGVRAPVLRSGARPGDVLAVSGQVGRSGAGWHLLEHGVLRGRTAEEDALLRHHRRPVVDLDQGPIAARAGASAMIDVSDGLVRDAGRIAAASRVGVHLDEDAIRGMTHALTSVLAPGEALRQVLTGGEEHELLATFPQEGAVPEGWTVLGRIAALEEPGLDGAAADERGAGVWWQGRLLDPSQGGWDHFGG